MNDVLGEALSDYHFKLGTATLWINNHYGPPEEMPVETFFRGENEMPEIELIALQDCTGTVLDIGAGAGSHCLALQQRGIEVLGLDISPKAVTVMKDRGVRQAIAANITDYRHQPFDTLLLLMNGIGLTGTLEGLKDFLMNAQHLVSPDGQIVFDSSDVAYLYEGNLPSESAYYGELEYQYEYKNQKTGWFKWLYADYQTMYKISMEAGWQSELLFDDGYDQYLTRLTRIS